MDTRISHENFRAFNEDMSRKYGPDKYHRTRVSVIRFAEAVKVRLIKAALGPVNRGLLVDVGCGSCDVMNKLKFDVKVGLDLSSYLLQYAREHNPDSVLVQASADALPFRDKSLPCVLITDVIEHVRDPAGVVRELARVAEPEATVILSVPNDGYIGKWKRFLKGLSLQHAFLPEYYRGKERAGLKNDWHLHVFSLKDIIGLVSEYFLVNKIFFIPFKILPFQHLLILTPRK